MKYIAFFRLAIFLLNLFYHANAQSANAIALAGAVCPKYNVFTKDLNNPQVEFENTCYWIDKLWNSTFPVLSPNAIALGNLLRRMGESNNSLWRRVASTLSAWVWSNLPQIESKPNFCGFTKIINATIFSDGSQMDCDLLRDGLATVASTVLDSSKYVSASAKAAAGCLVPMSPKPTVEPCFNQGKTYSRRDFWRKRGSKFPLLYQKYARRLARSCSYQDQFIAAAAHAVASGPMVDYYDSFNKTFLYQAFTLQTVSKIPIYCCPSLNNDIDCTMCFADGVSKSAMDKAMASCGCPV